MDDREAVPQVRALRHHRDEIEACIKEDNFPDFAREVFEWGFIPQTVKDSLDSLDPSVSHCLKLRYLFINVYKQLNTSSQNFEKFLDLLSKQNVSSGVTAQVRITCKSYSTQGLYSQISMDTAMVLADGISGALVGMKRPRTPGLFLHRHLSDLTEILALSSHKWREIGTSLNLPPNILDDIYQLKNESIIKLTKVFEKWIEGFPSLQQKIV